MSITKCDEFYLKKHSKFIEFVVNKFIAKGNWQSANIREDLFQEAQLALLKWINRQKDKRNVDISKSYISISGRLYEYVQRNTGIHMRHHKLKEFYKKCSFVPYELKDASYFKSEDVDWKIDFDRWRDTLSIKQNAILSLKLAGYGEDRIGEILNISRQTVNHSINNAIRNSYNAYFHPEQNPAPARKCKSKSTPAAA